MIHFTCTDYEGNLLVLLYFDVLVSDPWEEGDRGVRFSEWARGLKLKYDFPYKTI